VSEQSGSWQPDPFGRHQYRYWDGAEWTDQVSNDGVVSTDPPIADAVAAAAEPTPEPAASELPPTEPVPPAQPVPPPSEPGGWAPPDATTAMPASAAPPPSSGGPGAPADTGDGGGGSSNLPGIIVGVVILLILIGVAAWFLFLRDDDDDEATISTTDTTTTTTTIDTDTTAPADTSGPGTGTSIPSAMMELFIQGVMAESGLSEAQARCFSEEFLALDSIDFAELFSDPDAFGEEAFSDPSMAFAFFEIFDTCGIDPSDFDGGGGFTGTGDTYGDDPELDALWDACAGGDMESCDDLYFQSPFNSGYETFGDTCGGRQPEGTGNLCVTEFG
jgi:hypothetical protein